MIKNDSNLFSAFLRGAGYSKLPLTIVKNGARHSFENPVKLLSLQDYGHTLKIFLHSDSKNSQSRGVASRSDKFNALSWVYSKRDRVSRVEVICSNSSSSSVSDWNCWSVRLWLSTDGIELQYSTDGKDIRTPTLFPPKELFEQEHREMRKQGEAH